MNWSSINHGLVKYLYVFFGWRDGYRKVKRHISPCIDQILSVFIKVGGRKIRCQICKHINSIWSNKELPVEYKESIMVPIHKKADTRDCSNYRGISVLMQHPVWKLTSFAEEIIGDHQCGFWRKMLTTDHNTAFIKYLRKNWNTIKQCISYL